MSLKNKAITLVVFFMFLNAAPGVMVASGFAEDAGAVPAVSGGDNIDSANEAMSDIDVSGGFANTLFALYTSVTGPVGVVLDILIGADIMLMSMGIPGWLVGFFMAPKYLLMGATLIYVLAGRRL